MNNEKLEIAIFGSAFNPPSLGHLSVLERLVHFDKVLLVPSIAHAWGKDMLSFSLRCKLVEAFIEDLVQENIEAFWGEFELQHQLAKEKKQTLEQTSVTTFDLLSHVQAQYPNANLTFVLGPDNLLNFSKFYNSELILKRWQILMCPETVQVRSTMIRENIAAKRSISDLVTPCVAERITQLALFQ